MMMMMMMTPAAAAAAEGLPLTLPLKPLRKAGPPTLPGPIRRVVPHPPVGPQPNVPA